MIIPLKGKKPKIGKDVYIAESAQVIALVQEVWSQKEKEFQKEV